ncbi:hypothetical protein [Dyadobacter sandarakinus]|nr:hypothetical protein [Dyadobacter sandarakinus]
MQGSAATQVWQPLWTKGDQIGMPGFYESWYFNETGRWYQVDHNFKAQAVEKMEITGDWQPANSGLKVKRQGSELTIPFYGHQVALKGSSDSNSGYAKITLQDSSGAAIYSSVADFYSKATETSFKFVSPSLAIGNYRLIIEPLGKHPAWSDKKKSVYGSKDDYVRVGSVFIR